MSTFDRKKHWENIYDNKNIDEVSWYQPTPSTSLEFIEQFNLPKSAKIIDIGGGDSFLVDHLLELGYQNITVLDISANAIERAKQRLGESAEHVNWIIADVAEFTPEEHYDLWHDRAAFHFLTNERDIEQYLNTVQSHIKPGGNLVIGTFSEQGPTKCSGIEIKQYNEQSLSAQVERFFNKIKCITVDHKTPFNTVQNFVFCGFQRIAA